MIQDKLATFSGTAIGNTITGQTVTGTGNVASTDVFDVSSRSSALQVRDIGAGHQVYGRFSVITAAVGGTSIDFQIVMADDAALTTNVEVLASTGAIAIARLIAGARFANALRPDIERLGRRYIGARYVIAGTMSAGAYFADLGLEVQDFKAYPRAYQIL